AAGADPDGRHGPDGHPDDADAGRQPEQSELRFVRGENEHPATVSRESRLTMAKTRELVKRRKAVRNIRKITRTMELIATSRFKRALDRATAADAYTRRIAELAADLSATVANV